MTLPGVIRQLLLVDDDEDIRDCLRECLCSEGYEVYEAEHGQAPLNLLRSGIHPDVILLDLMMPVMNGFEFLEACRRNPECRDTPVIVVSASPIAAFFACPLATRERRRRSQALHSLLHRKFEQLT